MRRFWIAFLIASMLGPRISLAQQAAAAPAPSAALANKAGAPDPIAKQTASVAAMQPAIQKQKTSVQAQIGAGGPADTFFTGAWISPPEIPVPVIVPGCVAMPDSDLKPLIAESAKAQDVKAELIRAVIRHESASYPCAISEKGAVGLMQLMPEVAQQFNVDPLDPKQNIQAGTKYLKQLLGRYKGDMKLAVAAYNAGPQRVDAENKVPDIPETTAYVDAVLKDLAPTPPASQP